MLLIKISDDEGDGKWVIVCCVLAVGGGRPIKPTRLVFNSDGMYCLEILDQCLVMEGVAAPSQGHL